MIDIGIVDDEDYVKNEEFMIELGEPIGESNEARVDENDKEIADLGKPVLGERKIITIQIKESKVIKV